MTIIVKGKAAKLFKKSRYLNDIAEQELKKNKITWEPFDNGADANVLKIDNEKLLLMSIRETRKSSMDDRIKTLKLVYEKLRPLNLVANYYGDIRSYYSDSDNMGLVISTVEFLKIIPWKNYKKVFATPSILVNELFYFFFTSF